MKTTIQTNKHKTKSGFRRLIQSLCVAVSLASASICTLAATASDQVPGAPQKKPIIIRSATIHTVSGDTIENGSLIFKDGKITEIGINLPFTDGFEVIDAKGQHVFPGLVDAYSNIGLIEIESVRATIDTSETGNINPNVRSAVAVNPDSDAIPVARANGVLLALVAPTGGLVSGRSAFMMLDGWTWENMTLKPDTAMVVNWPRFGGGGAGRGRFRRADDEAGGAADADRLAPMHELFRETKAYAAAKAAAPKETPTDLRLEAMIPVVEGSVPMLISANSVKQIQTAVAFAKQYNIKVILVGGSDALPVAHLLREAKIPLIVSSVYRLPGRHDAPYDSAYALPGQLQAAGVQFAIAGDGRFGASTVRNLPNHAAAAVAFGLSEADALRAITLTPAEIFGVADRVGSLTVGKDATLFIADGNILETSTNVKKAFIQGRAVDLTSRHTQLNDKYIQKYKE